MKIAFLDNSWNNTKDGNYSGVGYYRIVQPAKYIKKHDIRVIGSDIKRYSEKAEDTLHDIVRDHDIIVTKAIDNMQAASNLIFFKQHYNKKLVIDLDDNYFEVRPDQPGYKWYYPGSQKRATMSSYLSFAYHIIVSTQPLADYHKDFLKKVHNQDKEITVIPNFNDFSEFNYRYKGNGDRRFIRIGWQGSTTHFSDLKMVIPAIKQIMEKYPNVLMDFMGGIEVNQVRDLFGDFSDEMFKRISIIGGTPSWAGYPWKLSKTRWDIGICPLIDDEFNRNKSHIKWMEYSSYKIPTIASRVYPYFVKINGKKTIENGITGFLAKNTKEWVKYLSLLIENKELRETIGQNAYNHIKSEWQMKNNANLYEELFDKIICNSQTQQTKTE